MPTVAYLIHDAELGQVEVCPDSRARRFIFRVRDGVLRATVPTSATPADVRRAIGSLRPRLGNALQRCPVRHIDLDYGIHTDLFDFTLALGTGTRFCVADTPDGTVLRCPPGTDFDDPALQDWLQKVVVRLLRRVAGQVLPPRLDRLACRHGLTYTGVRIGSSRSRWGSCSAQGSINLSCFLLKLPARLVDYVLLHELAHTREMNHGPRFHALLDRITDGQAAACEAEIKRYGTGL